MKDQVHIINLEYSLNFRDSDEGDCHAGECSRFLEAHKYGKSAVEIVTEFNPIVREAEKETIVFPVQKFNAMLKRRFGFTLHDIDDGYNFRLVVNTHDIDERT